MDGQHQLVTVADEGHLGLREAPQILHAGVVLGNFKVKGGSVIGVFQILAVGILVGLSHFIGIVDEAGEQRQVGTFLTDLLGEQAVLLSAVLVLLNDLPPAVDGLTVGEGLGVIIPHGLRGVQRITVFQVAFVDVRADVLGIIGLQDVLVVPLVEHVAVDVLGLQYVGGDVAGVVLDFGLGEHFVSLQIGDHQIQAGISGLKALFHLHHLGGGGVDVDGGVLLQSFLEKLFVGLVAPFVIIGAVVVFAGVDVIAEMQVAGGFAVGLGVIGVALAAAGSQAQHHGQGEEQRKKLLHFHRGLLSYLDGGSAPSDFGGKLRIKTRLTPRV